jgi:hypothetical protein
MEVQNLDIVISRYRRNFDIDIQNFDIVISRYRRFLDIDQYSFDIYIRFQSFELRHRMSGSSISVFLCLGCCSSCSVLDTYCRVHYLLRIKRLACGLRLWKRLTQAGRPPESPSSRLEMTDRSAPLTLPRRLTLPEPGETVAQPKRQTHLRRYSCTGIS